MKFKSSFETNFTGNLTSIRIKGTEFDSFLVLKWHKQPAIHVGSRESEDNGARESPLDRCTVNLVNHQPMHCATRQPHTLIA